MGSKSQNKPNTLPNKLFGRQRDWAVWLKNNYDTEEDTFNHFIRNGQYPVR